MTRKFLALLLGLALAIPAVAHARAQKGKAKSPAAGGSGPVEDHGRFRVLVDGQPVGTEEFQISRSGNEWVARGSVEIPAAGGATSRLNGKLRVNDEGAPMHYEYDWSPHAGKKVSGSVTFQRGTARMETQVEGAPSFTQEFMFETPRVVILDNNFYHHYAILARLYDWEKKGAQTIPVLIPQDQTPGTLTVESLGPQEVEGARLDLLRVRSADLDIELYLDSARRVMRLSVPASKAEVLRETSP